MPNTLSLDEHRCPSATGAQEHGWSVESRHATSDGWIVYVRCLACGTRRVDLQEWEEQPPVALSNEVSRPIARAEPLAV